MTKPRVWIAQMLCPKRHCIAALVDVCADKAEARRKLGDVLSPQIDQLGVNPWCGLCGAPRERWHIELRRTSWRTMEEAEAPLRESEVRQVLTSLVYGTHGPKKPGSA